MSEHRWKQRRGTNTKSTLLPTDPACIKQKSKPDELIIICRDLSSNHAGNHLKGQLLQSRTFSTALLPRGMKSWCGRRDISIFRRLQQIESCFRTNSSSRSMRSPQAVKRIGTRPRRFGLRSASMRNKRCSGQKSTAVTEFQWECSNAWAGKKIVPMTCSNEIEFDDFVGNFVLIHFSRILVHGRSEQSIESRVALQRVTYRLFWSTSRADGHGLPSSRQWSHRSDTCCSMIDGQRDEDSTTNVKKSSSDSSARD